MRHFLLSFQNIYSVECRKWSCVKKTALFEHWEFVVFSNVVNEMSEPDSCQARRYILKYYNPAHHILKNSPNVEV